MIRTTAPLALAALLAGACAPSGTPSGPAPAPAPTTRALEYEPVSRALPPIPAANGPLDIRVVYPTAGQTRPRVDSTFVYGSVGRGGAALEINGTLVPVARNGAFLTYLPLPEDGVWRLRATAGGSVDTASVAYARPSQAGGSSGSSGGSTASGVFSAPRLATVTGGRDTLATGSDAVYARPTPTGTYRWFFPRGARLTALERRGSQVRVQLDTTSAWIDASAVRLDSAASVPRVAMLDTVRLIQAGADMDLRIPAGGRPFLVRPTETEILVTVYGATGGPITVNVARTNREVGSVSRIDAPGAATYRVLLAAPAWGYKAWYESDGTLVVRIRKPPVIDPANPLRGRRIVIDPGHPPAGATGPTGLYEGDANLAIALPLAEKLRARGAEVILTRTTREPLRSATNASVELGARVDLAVSSNAEVLISVHNNAFAEGANPWRALGTGTYYFQPFSADLARALDGEIVGVTQIRDFGAQVSNLALARPTWFPSVLTESLFMPVPEQEAALRDPAFLDRLAEAHVRGLEAFFRARAGTP